MPVIRFGPPPAAPLGQRGRIAGWLMAGAGLLSGFLGALVACAACCAPIVAGSGFLAGAAAAGLQNVFIGVAAALLAVAALVLILRRRRARRAEQGNCGGNCAC